MATSLRNMSALRSALHSLNGQIANASDAIAQRRLLLQYIATAQQLGGLMANGAAVVGGIVPGGAIVSAAVSSVGGMTNHATPGGSSVASSYGA